MRISRHCPRKRNFRWKWNGRQARGEGETARGAGKIKDKENAKMKIRYAIIPKLNTLSAKEMDLFIFLGKKTGPVYRLRGRDLLPGGHESHRDVQAVFL